MTGAGALLFPGRNNPKKPMSDMALTVLVRRICYAGRVTGYGFRHTMSTILHEQGFNPAWIELQLAHVDKNSIRGTYNHAQYLEGRREKGDDAVVFRLFNLWQQRLTNLSESKNILVFISY